MIMQVWWFVVCITFIVYPTTVTYTEKLNFRKKIGNFINSIDCTFPELYILKTFLFTVILDHKTAVIVNLRTLTSTQSGSGITICC